MNNNKDAKNVYGDKDISRYFSFIFDLLNILNKKGAIPFDTKIFSC